MKKLLIGMMTLAAATVAVAATKGSCESAAASLPIGRSTSVRLVGEEYDTEENTYDDDSGVYYLAVTLSRGSAYTLTYSGSSADFVDVTGYPRETTEKEDDNEIYAPYASFSEAGDYDGVYVQYLQADEWDSDDPSSWKFYIKVRGEVGDSVSVTLTSGIVPYATPGTPENPTTLTFSDAGNSSTYTFVDDQYFFTASLREGRFYRVRTTGGTAVMPVGLEVNAEDADYDVIEDQEYASDTNNTSAIIVPSESATFTLVASGTNSIFGLAWRSIPTRAIAAHPAVTLDLSNDFMASFVPGRMISSYNYADNIVDEGLCKITLAKGERWVFTTEGATAKSTMYLYDSRGTIIAKNGTIGNGSDDMLIGYKAPASGTYYVGVCEDGLGVMDEPAGGEIVLMATRIEAADGEPDEWDSADDTNAGATPLAPLPAGEILDPVGDGAIHGPHRLSMTDWADTYVIAARKGITYVLTSGLLGEGYTDLTLQAEVYTLSGSSERKVTNVTGGIDPTAEDFLTFTATANAAYYIRLSVAEGNGLEYPDYAVYATAFAEGDAPLGILTVNTPGAPTATWSLGSESVKYPGGSSVLVAGAQTIKFSTVTGYKAAQKQVTVDVAGGSTPTVVEVKYIDTYDPKDDAVTGRSGTVSHSPTAISFKNVDTDYAKRTLWEDDPEDNFAISGKDGYLFDIALRNVEGDAVVFSITNAQDGVVVENVSSVTQLALPKLAAPYASAKHILTVKNAAGATSFGGYTLAGKYANVGAIKFASTKVSAKENAASVKLKVNRTAKDGYVRVRYGTVAGTAVPGKDYVAQNGILEWASGDNKAKTIEVKLIPDLVPVYEAASKTFSVQLKPFDPEDRTASEYPAVIAGGDTCVVTLTEASKAGTTVEKSYAAKAPKLATVRTETVPLESGTFYGVLAEDGSALTNGLPQFASVTLTASTANPSALSARVALAGNSYTFSAKGWDEGEAAGTVSKEFFLAKRVNRVDEETGRTVSVTVTNTLVVTAASGATATEGDWLKAGATAELVMNVPDTNNKGYQEEIYYKGRLYRQNAKIQDYLNVVTNFTGYYTVALAASGVGATEAPAGNGYLTLTVDNKGTVKVAGALADGTTKPSLSVVACALEEDDASANGYSMYVPVYYVKSPMVLAGELRLYADESGKVVVDPAAAVVWNNDNPSATYYGEDGFRLSLDPVGGWYDTVVNLQTYYLTRAFEVSTADVLEFFAEALTANTQTKDYHYVDNPQPNGFAVDLTGDVFSTAKKKLEKSGTIYNLAASTNACNVQVKLSRATGIVTGTFSLWSESVDGAKQKELTGLKHFGVLVMNRAAASPIDAEIVSAGFCTQSVKVTDVNEDTGRTTTRNWTASLPFNILGVNQGDNDWWADDWGDPESGD